MNVQKRIMQLLEQHNISYRLYKHGPILNYDDAQREQKIHKWQWVESKSVFLTNKKWAYFLFVTIQGRNVDFKKMKELVWQKLSIATHEEVGNIAQCAPWCVAPFWLDSQIQMVIDTGIFQYESYLFSPGIATETVELEAKDLKDIFCLSPDTIFI